MRAALAHRFRYRILGAAEPIHQLAVGQSLLDRVEIDPLHIFDDADLQHLAVGQFTEHHRQLAQARALGRQVLPETPGLDLPCVVSGDRVLAGGVELSGRVVVIDDNGHWEAAGTAEYLADQGCRVDLIATHAGVGIDMEGGNRALFHRRAAVKGIRIRVNTLVTEIAAHRVQIAAVYSSADAIGWGKYVLLPGDEEWLEDVDWVVPVTGRRSREDLYLALKDDPDFAAVRIERVGDCVAPRLIQSTIAEAFALAQTL